MDVLQKAWRIAVVAVLVVTVVGPRVTQARATIMPHTGAVLDAARAVMFCLLFMVFAVWLSLCCRGLSATLLEGRAPERPTAASLRAGFTCVAVVWLLVMGVQAMVAGGVRWPELALVGFLWLGTAVLVFGIRVEITGNVFLDTLAVSAAVVLLSCVMSLGACGVWSRGVTLDQILAGAFVAAALGLLFRAFYWAWE